MNHLHRVFTIHDPRLPDEKSVVYVGISKLEDPNRHIASILRKKLPKLHGELERANKKAEVRLYEPLNRETAFALRAEIVEKSEALGCDITLGKKRRPLPFVLREVIWKRGESSGPSPSNPASTK